MDVILDGAGNYDLKGEPRDVLAALAAVSDFLKSQGRSILSVKVDGDDVQPEELPARLKGVDPASVRRLEIGSESTTVLIEASLKGLNETLPELPSVCRSLAEVFQGDTPEAGFDPFVELAGIWAQIKSRESLVANALSVNLDDLAVNGKSLATVHEELNQFLEEAEQALKDGDMILLGDLLEYELAPRAEQEVEIVALLQAQIPSSPA